MSKTKKPALRKIDVPSPSVDLEELDRFAAGAVEVEKNKTKPKGLKKKKTGHYPWQESWVRQDVIKGMGVPLSEPHLLKLQYIAKMTKYSQRSFCREMLEKAIDREVRKLIAEDSD